MVIYSKYFITIEHDRELECLIQKWTGYCPGEDFRDAIDFSMDYLNDHGLYKIISDVTDQRIVSPGDQEYVKEKVKSYVERNRQFRMAFVVGKNSIPKICAEQYDRQVTRELNEVVNCFFDDMVKAREWIRGV